MTFSARRSGIFGECRRYCFPRPREITLCSWSTRTPATGGAHDLARLPDDGNRYEVLDGKLFVTPQASVPHQWIAAEVIVRLSALLKRHNTRLALWRPAPSSLKTTNCSPT